MTANVLGDIVERCREVGMNGYIAKRFNVRKLANLLAAQNTPANMARHDVKPGATGDRALDMTMVQEMFEHLGRDEVADFTRDAEQSIPARAAQVIAAIGDPVALGRLAHSLASTAAAAGLVELSALGQRIERLCAERRLDEARAATAEIPATVDRALAAPQPYTGFQSVRA